MMTRVRSLAMTMVVSAALVSISATAHAQDAQTCQPGILDAYNGSHQARYVTLINALVPQTGQLIADVAAMVDQATYATLLTHSQALAASITAGRVVITLPDGTTAVDTSKNNNTYANFLAKAINENHNSRVAILAAQQYQCGLGLESKFSTTDGQLESYFAIRLGNHLDAYGTARISTKQ